MKTLTHWSNVLLLVLILSLGAGIGWLSHSWLALFLLFPAAVLGSLLLYNRFQTRHALLRNYPLLGYVRYLSESIRPELRQYFFESDLDGKPFNRRQRSIVYQRAKNERATVPFGMQQNNLEPGFEWVAHSLFPRKPEAHSTRCLIGEAQCEQPYYASILNIAAMSYGALSKTAISSLNAGAALGRFAHNTGEGGISRYHTEPGGDLIWQIGTGYFGCRKENGQFDPDLFREQSVLPQIKMIEVKLSQGAKPGHGGILPAAKNTPEIAAIRKVQPHTVVLSPPGHTAFYDYLSMLEFLAELRKLSGGKPVGIKMSIGHRTEFELLCKTITATGLYPDFITIDGAEGGTGAAPLEFSDSIGMPLHDALSFASHTLVNSGYREKIKLIAAGKIITGFDILKAIALGADLVYSARGMMMALGCIQALKCDSGTCPVGVATQDPTLYKGIVVSDKSQRVYNFHRNTLEATLELMEACGFKTLEQVKPEQFFRRMPDGNFKSFRELYFNISALKPA